MGAETVIARLPPSDGREWDCQCARCGSSVERVVCEECGGEGFTTEEEEDDACCGEEERRCETRLGRRGWWRCFSSPEWCETHPNEGREKVGRGAIEWYTLDERRHG